MYTLLLVLCSYPVYIKKYCIANIIDTGLLTSFIKKFSFQVLFNKQYKYLLLITPKTLKNEITICKRQMQ